MALGIECPAYAAQSVREREGERPRRVGDQFSSREVSAVSSSLNLLSLRGNSGGDGSPALTSASKAGKNLRVREERYQASPHEMPDSTIKHPMTRSIGCVHPIPQNHQKPGLVLLPARVYGTRCSEERATPDAACRWSRRSAPVHSPVPKQHCGARRLPESMPRAGVQGTQQPPT